MSEHKLLITPQTKVGELLNAYPALESVLVEVAPAFEKLRNPILRRTVARVTSLAQAARVGGVSVIELVQRLRREVGQPEFDTGEPQTESGCASDAAPVWFDETKITKRLDARPMIDAGEQPIGRVLREIDSLGADEIYELTTPFEPAPLIDKARSKGFVVWSRAVTRNDHRTYFRRE
jgi:hypothetical protein